MSLFRRPQKAHKNAFGIWHDRQLVGVAYLSSEGRYAAQIGYWIGKKYVRERYATTAVRALCGYALIKRQVVTAYVHPDNTASRKVLSLCGFTETCVHMESGRLYYTKRAPRAR